MPKATLSFNLNDEDDKEKFELANKAVDMSIFIHNFENHLRSLNKQEYDAVNIEDLCNNYYKLKSSYGL